MFEKFVTTSWKIFFSLFDYMFPILRYFWHDPVLTEQINNLKNQNENLNQIIGNMKIRLQRYDAQRNNNSEKLDMLGETIERKNETFLLRPSPFQDEKKMTQKNQNSVEGTFSNHIANKIVQIMNKIPDVELDQLNDIETIQDYIRKGEAYGNLLKQFYDYLAHGEHTICFLRHKCYPPIRLFESDLVCDGWPIVEYGGRVNELYVLQIDVTNAFQPSEEDEEEEEEEEEEVGEEEEEETI